MENRFFQLHRDRAQKQRRAYNQRQLCKHLTQHRSLPSIIHRTVIRVDMTGKRAVGQKLAADSCVLANLICYASLDFGVSIGLYRVFCSKLTMSPVDQYQLPQEA